MKNVLLIADELKHLDGLGKPYPMVTTRDYVADASSTHYRGQRVINLSRSFVYQSMGYYASLLGEARGHRAIPSVETCLDLSNRSGYERALPELEASLNKALKSQPELGLPSEFYINLGTSEDTRLIGFSRLIFDWFRAPVLIVSITPPTEVGSWVSISRIKIANFNKLDNEQKQRFADVLAAQSRYVWGSPKRKVPARYSLAVLYDPDEALPPTSPKSLKHFAQIAEREGVEVEPITRKDLARLAEFDALFIRETTSIRNHTYRFAQRARAEGMPVIDDPTSMIRCTNKIYLWERLVKANLPTPHTIVMSKQTKLEKIADTLSFPLVVKVPDGSFSRGVKKANNMAEFENVTGRFFKESELLLAQEFTPTNFDWRIGVLGGQAIFACQYMMAKNHWQIVNHKGNGQAIEGGFKTFALEEVNPHIIDVAIRSANLIGDGFYGVDLKETIDGGVTVIEINDNPNLEHRIEDAVSRDEVWLQVTQWFTQRLHR